jgi:hypothetical protein
MAGVEEVAAMTGVEVMKNTVGKNEASPKMPIT